jgi:hypothetical protein
LFLFLVKHLTAVTVKNNTIFKYKKIFSVTKTFNINKYKKIKILNIFN